MQIVVNHLTRMQKGYMCVAGIDLDSHLHVRPVLDRQMPVDLLSVHGGPFDMARIIDLGETRFVGKVPEVEDRWFDAASARHTGDMASGEFRALLEQVAQEKLGTIFGPDLERAGSTCAVAETSGLRSLGCYWASAGRLLVDNARERPSIRFHWQAGDHAFSTPVTDIRLFEEDHVTPCDATVRRLADRIAAQPRILLSVGLSRPFRKTADDPPRHWLQINNFHLPDNPCWTLANC
ncbi:MAG: hypothetical protein L0228_03835 [Planctomycetes bacterium]|nr:hypothetical protein [Planctomycetota bacterium]